MKNGKLKIKIELYFIIFLILIYLKKKMEENSIIYLLDEHSKIIENKKILIGLHTYNNIFKINNDNINQIILDYNLKSYDYFKKINDLYQKKYCIDTDENVLKKIKEEKEKILKLNNEINDLNNKIDDYY